MIELKDITICFYILGSPGRGGASGWKPGVN